MPTPTPTSEELAIVREICITETPATIAARVIELTDVEWLRTLDDVDLWEGGVKNDYTHITGQVVINPNDPRIDLINRVRRRLSLSLIFIGENGQIVISYTESGFGASACTLRSLKWF